MTFNEQTLKGKWQEVKGDIQKMWGKLTNDELEQTKGDAKSIAGLVEQRYGQGKEDFHQKMSDLFSKYDDKKDTFVDKVKDGLKEDKQ